MQNTTQISQTSPLMRLLSASTALALADGISLLVNAVFIVLFGRMYGSAALGQFSFALAVSGLSLTVVDAGFDITLPRTISREPESAYRRTFDALRVKIMIACLVLPLAISFSFIKDAHTILATIILALDVLPTALAYAVLCSLRGLQYAQQGSRIHAFYNMLCILPNIPLLWFNLPFPVFAAVILVGDTLKFVHLLSFFSRVTGTRLSIGSVFFPTAQQPWWNTPLLREAYREQRGVTLTNLLSSALIRMPSIMLGWLATNAQHGVYAAASRFFSSLRFVPGAVFNTLLPEYSQRTMPLARIRSVMALAVLAAALLSAFLYFGAPLLISSTFAYTESVAILQILALGFGALFLKTTLESFLLAAHKEHIVNAILGMVTLCAVIAYAYNARVSPLNVAWTVSIAEWLLFLSLLTIFLWMKRTSRSSSSSAHHDHVSSHYQREL